METIHGTITEIIFRNDENAYSVVEIRSQRDTITVIGAMPEMTPGEKASFEGEWTEHPQYGRQFKASACRVETPTTLGGIERYLASGLIKGVGPTTARLIVSEFGEETLAVMSEHPERLTEVRGIGPVRARQITQSFMEQHAARQTLLFLQTYGISPALSLKISKKYQDRAEALIRENPYRMIDDIEGVGFRTADKIALSLGIPRGSEYRLRSGIKYALMEAATASGHTYLPRDTLIRQAAELLQMPADTIAIELNALLLSKELHADDTGGDAASDAISLHDFYFAEVEIAKRLINLNQFYQQTLAGYTGSQIAAYERSHGIHFSATQRQAIKTAAQSGVLVITGGPGTGKTTLINCILHVIGDSSNTFLAAPTGRAAKRMKEATGMDAKTLHRLLEFSGESSQFTRNQDNPLDCTTLIIDETSMVDIFLMRSVLRAVTLGTRLILVGDADQLPSVGPGNVLSDILDSGAIPQVRLTEIFRQDEQSHIVINAHRINRGDMPLLNIKGSDFFFQKTASPDEAASVIADLCHVRLPGYLHTRAGRDIQVLSPTRKGVCGVAAINKLLQQTLNPAQPGKPEMAYGETVFRLGDKVIHIKNNYQLKWVSGNGEEGEGVFNGDVGYIAGIDDDDRSLTVLYDDDRHVDYEYTQLEELELAYCLSVHKSQGSEFDAVVMPAVGGPPMLLNRNLLYTAVTRARKLVVLVGSEPAIAAMTRNNRINRRYSSLSRRLTEPI